MALTNSTSKKSRTDSSVLYVLMIQEKVNVTPTAKVKNKCSRNRMIGKE